MSPPGPRSADDEPARAAQRGQCALGDEPALLEHADAVADVFDLAEQVAGEQHGLLTLSHGTNQRAHLGDAARVQAIGRLIQDQERGILEQRRGQAQALLHAQRIAVLC